MATGNAFTTSQAPLSMTAAQQILYPEIAAQQTQVSRQQQLAQMLREQAMTPGDPTQVIGGWAVKQSPWAGVGKMAQALAGGYAQNQVDEKQLALAKTLQVEMNKTMGGTAQPTGPQYQNDPNGTDGPMPGQLGSGMSSAADPNIAPPAQTGGDPTVSMGGMPTIPPNGPVPVAPQPTQNNYNLGNLLKGSVISSIGGDAAGKSYWDQFGTTDATKMATAAGVDTKQANTDALTKANYIAPVNARPGSILRDPKTNMPLAYNPHIPDGAQPLFDASGNVVSMNAIPGAMDLMQQSSKATAAGKASVEPISGFQNGQPVFTNKLAASQGGSSTQGGAGVNAGSFGGYAPAGGGGAIAPGLAPGIDAAASGMATQNTKRAGVLTDASADSPTRVNVLDNIINLSKSGVDTGPTADFTNKIKGYAANIPGFSGWKDDVTGFQEVKKFLSQNAIRAWTAAGGTGTDSQMSAAQQANPNDKMFPKAIQDMASWAKAGELALQSKSAAQDSWLARNNNNPAAQNQFESAWRTNFDPRIYQMKLMDPAQLQTFATKLPQSDRDTLMKKYSTAKQNGWIQ